MTYLPIDWIATAISLSGMWLLPTHKRTSIVLFLLGNAIWLAWSFQTGNWGVAANYVIMGCLNARTLWTWVREARAAAMTLQGVSV